MSGLFGGHKSGSSWGWLWSHRLLHFRSGNSNWWIDYLGKHNMTGSLRIWYRGTWSKY